MRPGMSDGRAFTDYLSSCRMNMNIHIHIKIHAHINKKLHMYGNYDYKSNFLNINVSLILYNIS